MSTESPFSEIETVQFEGMTFASVYDLVIWLKSMGDDDSAFTDVERKAFLYVINQLTRLVTK